MQINIIKRAFFFPPFEDAKICVLTFGVEQKKKHENKSVHKNKIIYQSI